MSVVVLFFDLLGCLCCLFFFFLLNCFVLWLTLLCLFQVVNSVFIVSVCGGFLSVVVGCSLFRLFEALSSHLLSHIFELFKFVFMSSSLSHVFSLFWVLVGCLDCFRLCVVVVQWLWLCHAVLADV